jgi:hypothetical protein
MKPTQCTPTHPRLSDVMKSVTKGTNMCLVDLNATNKNKQSKQPSKLLHREMIDNMGWEGVKKDLEGHRKTCYIALVEHNKIGQF